MQDEKQGTNRSRTEKRNTGGLPVARDATQLGETRRTPESQGDREEEFGTCDPAKDHSAPPAER